MRVQWLRVLVAVVALALPASAPAIAQSASPEIEKLTAYSGDWRGESALVGGDRNEPFRCRLSVSQGNPGSVVYAGRCTLVNATLSISGTILFNAQTGNYEAAMSSNAGYTGRAVGRQNGDRISFDLREQQRDRAGQDVRIGAKIDLISDEITVDFEVEFNDSGEILTASVPFSL